MSEDIYSEGGAVRPVGNTGQSYGPHLHFDHATGLSVSYAHHKPLAQRDKFVLENMATEIHETAENKGFWDKPVQMDKYAAKLALVHSEVTEILEALRKDQGKQAVTEEFCDVIIRLLDLFDVLAEEGLAEAGIDEIMQEKLAKNASRPAKHGHKWG